MQLELNSSVSALAYTWQNAKGFTPIDDVYYVIAVFENGKRKPSEVYVVVGHTGRYYSPEWDEFIDFTTLHENDSHTVLIHPVPSLSTEVSEV